MLHKLIQYNTLLENEESLSKAQTALSLEHRTREKEQSEKIIELLPKNTSETISKGFSRDGQVGVGEKSSP